MPKRITYVGFELQKCVFERGRAARTHRLDGYCGCDSNAREQTHEATRVSGADGECSGRTSGAADVGPRGTSGLRALTPRRGGMRRRSTTASACRAVAAEVADAPADPVTPPYLTRRRPSSPSTSAGNCSSTTSSSSRRHLDAHLPPAEGRTRPTRSSGPTSRGRSRRQRAHGDGVQRRRLVRPGGPAVQDVVHGRVRPRHLLRHRPRTASAGTKPELDVREGHQHRPARRARLGHRLARPTTRRTRSGGTRCSAATREGGRFGQSVYFSADGIHWGEPRASAPARPATAPPPSTTRSARCGSTASAHGWGGPRRRRYWETPDLVERAAVGEDRRAAACGSAPTSSTRSATTCKVPPQLYNLDCVAYESLLLGLFTIWRGDRTSAGPAEAERGLRRLQPRRLPLAPARPPRVHRRVGDGRATGTGATCSRPAAAAWSSATSCTSTSAAGPACRATARRATAAAATGLAVLRRDGFASMDAGDDGRHADDAAGALHAASTCSSTSTPDGGELTRRGARRGRARSSPGCRAANCVPVRGDKTRQAVTWKAAPTWRPRPASRCGSAST